VARLTFCGSRRNITRVVITDIPAGSRVLGVDVGGTSVKAEIADSAGNAVAALLALRGEIA
jgi:hypothetical protein